jgi:hypothetical protein
MRRLIAAIVLAAACCFAAPAAHAFSLLSPQSWPTPFNPYNWPFTLIPIPEVATDPNGGVTYGVLLATLFKAQNGDIRYIFAPDFNNNTDLGPGGNARLFSYPSEATQWYVTAGAQEHIARNVDVSYSTGRTHENWWSFEGRIFYERDPTERFFGIGNGSTEGDETNYTTEQVYVRGLFGWNITQNLQLAALFRPRYVRILEGAFSNIPQIGQLFPTVKGINGGTEIYNEARMTYDTRDSVDIPRAGGLALMYYGIADRRFMSSVSYNRFGGELRRYYSIGKRVTIAAHAFLQYTPAGPETPFWSMGRLGGDDSLLYDQEPLRGYGTGRYVDNNVSDLNVEVRTRVYETHLFGNDGIVELAPFFEAGRVWHDMSVFPWGDLHPVGGLGFRAVVQPFVVAYVDVGYGGEGSAIFSGINYPF